MRCSRCETGNPEGNRFCGHRRGAREKGFPECGTDEPAGEPAYLGCDAPPAVSDADSLQSWWRKPSRSRRTLQRGPAPQLLRPKANAAVFTVQFSGQIGSIEIVAGLDAGDCCGIVAI